MNNLKKKNPVSKIFRFPLSKKNWAGTLLFPYKVLIF